jgi:hypothetical protein
MKKRYLEIRYRESGSNTETLHKCLVYLTPVAGLCIHTAWRWNHFDGPNSFTRRNNNWNITQYPTGLKAFQHILTKEMALDIVMRYMSEGFNWVGLTGEEIVASNDAKAIKEMTQKVKKHIDDANKMLTGETGDE